MVREKYSGGYSTELIKLFKTRTAVKEADFLINFIKPGISVLDCGCGPGTITVGLAKEVYPGKITGIDISAKQVEMAKLCAAENRVTNTDFMVGSIYNLPFEDETFDLVFAHAIFQHLKDPLVALKEIKRVLKKGGMVALRDDDEGGVIIEPYGEQMKRVLKFLKDYVRENGGDPCVGRKFKMLLRESGFSNIQVSATCEYDNTAEEIEKRGMLAVKLIEQMTDTAIKLKWATLSEMNELKKICNMWAVNPDSFDTTIWCEAVAWKEE